MRAMGPARDNHCRVLASLVAAAPGTKAQRSQAQAPEQLRDDLIEACHYIRGCTVAPAHRGSRRLRVAGEQQLAPRGYPGEGGCFCPVSLTGSVDSELTFIAGRKLTAGIV